MGLQSLCGRVLLGLSLTLLLSSFCFADDKTIKVFGIGECADCKENNINTIHAFSGLHVSIDCKLENGEIKTRGEGELDKDGKFEVSLPKEMIKDGKLKEECYAQLHSASAAPCPAHNGIESSKIMIIKTDGKHSLKPTGNVKFSTALCTSAFLWPYFKYPPLPKLPPFPKDHPWKKNFPYFPPLNHFGHPFPLPPIPPIFKKPCPPTVPKPNPPSVPVYNPTPEPPVVKPLPPPVPIYKPKPKPEPPVVKPLPPPVPIYKPTPKPPVVKPLPPPVPVYKPPVVKPLPPPVPVYKPPVVKPLPPPVPVYEPPVVKPLPPPVPIYKPIPPFYKKPCPPLPQLPPFPKVPPFHHPFFPPLPPSIPHP
ncbi:proline-rich protein 4 isoform X6 [Nicotiana tomentosiformis]|uniref:proline-rich protein 4 isoform X6 n=1 Tax=Nicotiana tomentosiformis TaxID=4098 RepID=UPI00388C5517